MCLITCIDVVALTRLKGLLHCRELQMLVNTALSAWEQRPFRVHRQAVIFSLGVKPGEMKAAHVFLYLSEDATLADEQAAIRKLDKSQNIYQTIGELRTQVHFSPCRNCSTQDSGLEVEPCSCMTPQAF